MRIVVIRFLLLVAKIDHFVLSRAQHSNPILPRFKSSMIDSDPNAFRSPVGTLRNSVLVFSGKTTIVRE